MVTNEHLTRISYIEAILNVKYTGTSINDVSEFINKHYQHARKKEPTLKDCLHAKKN